MIYKFKKKIYKILQTPSFSCQSFSGKGGMWCWNSLLSIIIQLEFLIINLSIESFNYRQHTIWNNIFMILFYLPTWSSLGTSWLFSDVMKKSEKYNVLFTCSNVHVWLKPTLLIFYTFRYFVTDIACDEITHIPVFILKWLQKKCFFKFILNLSI